MQWIQIMRWSECDKPKKVKSTNKQINEQFNHFAVMLIVTSQLLHICIFQQTHQFYGDVDKTSKTNEKYMRNSQINYILFE